MYSIKKLLLVLIFMLYGTHGYTADELAEVEIDNGLRYYGKLFKEDDPDFLFNEPTFDVDKFGKFAIDYLNFLAKRPVIPADQFIEFMCVFRAIATYARLSDQIIPLLTSLPLDDFFADALKHLNKIFIAADQNFKEIMCRPLTESFSADLFWEYLDNEGNSVFASHLLLFLFYLYEKESLYPDEIKKFNPILMDYCRQSEARLFSVLMEQMKVMSEAFEELVLSSNNERSMFFPGGRFSATGVVVNKVKSMRDKLAEEINEERKKENEKKPVSRSPKILHHDMKKSNSDSFIRELRHNRRSLKSKRVKSKLSAADQENIRIQAAFYMMLMSQALPVFTFPH